MIADSHCHLDYSHLFDQLDEVVKRAQLNRVKYLLTICTTLESFEKIKLIIGKYVDIYGTFGIHPHESDKHKKVDLQFILNVKKKYKKIIGIGETGLDFYYNHSNRDIQISSFKTHIEAGIALNIPIIVHSRNADNETFDILNSYKSFKPKILMHCFTGSKIFADKLMSLNAYFSASGIITFQNSIDLQNTFKSIPVEKLLVETDSPFLAPVPMRGKNNEPSYIKFTLEKLAIIKSIKISEIDELTSNNFQSLFSLS